MYKKREKLLRTGKYVSCYLYKEWEESECIAIEELSEDLYNMVVIERLVGCSEGQIPIRWRMYESDSIIESYLREILGEEKRPMVDRSAVWRIVQIYEVKWWWVKTLKYSRKTERIERESFIVDEWSYGRSVGVSYWSGVALKICGLKCQRK